MLSDDTNHVITSQKSLSSKDSEAVSRGPNLSASSSSSSEDEFDTLVKNWSEEEALNTVVVKESTSSSREQKVTDTAKQKQSHC